MQGDIQNAIGVMLCARERTRIYDVVGTKAASRMSDLHSASQSGSRVLNAKSAVCPTLSGKHDHCLVFEGYGGSGFPI